MFHLKNELSPCLEEIQTTEKWAWTLEERKGKPDGCVVLINLSKYAHIHVHIPPASKYLILLCVDRVQDTLPEIWHLGILNILS